MAKKEIQDALQRWRSLVERIQAATQNTPTQTVEQKAITIKRLQDDYRFFVSFLFPHLAKKACAKFQVDAAYKLKKTKNIRALLEWARGHAKSSHLSLLIPLWLMIQDERMLNFMVLVSKSEDSAKRLLGDLQAELEYNKFFQYYFGTQFKDGSWTDGEFTTAQGVTFIAIGRGQSPRGLKERGQRPDYIVIDDIDDDEMCRNEKRVNDTLEWVLTALLGTMEMGRGRFVMVGNRIAKNSVLAKFAKRPGIYHTIVNALDKNGQPTWHENYTLKEIMDLRELAGERNFQKEYMNNPLIEGAVFKQKHIRFGKILPLKEYKSLICYTDPSFKNSANSDYKATVLIGKTKEGIYHVLKVFAGQTSVSEMVLWHYTINDYVSGQVPVQYFMEANFLQDLLLDEFRKEGNLCGFQIPIRGDKRSKPDKFARIEALEPLFERGLVIFNETEQSSPGMKILIDQLLMFERGSRSKDDAPDALEGAIFLLNKRWSDITPVYRSGGRPSRSY
jgi:predicted phage terminase large subunit-like protein